MSRFELKVQADPLRSPDTAARGGLSIPALLHNTHWFVHIRWFVAVAFLLAGCMGRLLEWVSAFMGLALSTKTLVSMAAVLIAANLVYFFVHRRMGEDSPRAAVETHIWVQVIVDLLVLSLLLHLIGGTRTALAFTYLLHIVIACIFFSQLQSLLVTLLAAALHLFFVHLEAFCPWAQSMSDIGPASSSDMAFAWATAGIWFVVWYLASAMSSWVRTRDRQLADANEKLLQADEEKNTQVLRVTHDLKSPFTGIESNIQILRYKHWDTIPPETRDIIVKIEKRSAVLRERIRDILTLGELKARAGRTLELRTVDLSAVLKSVVDYLLEAASHRDVSLLLEASPAEVVADQRQLNALFSNLISNAIAYSDSGGTVTVTVREDADGVRVRVADQGIGIADEALPHIFDEYYRTEAAARKNSGSTGLGLAIVKRVAANLNANLAVESTKGKGTTFEVMFGQKGKGHHGTHKDN